MAEQFVAASPVVSNDFSVQCQHLVSTFKKRGMPLPDMRHEGMMELQISSGGFNVRSGTLAGSIGISGSKVRFARFHGEGIDFHALRFFLDGAQKTYPMFNARALPIFATLSSAAILERDASGETQVGCQVTPRLTLPGSSRNMRTTHVSPNLQRYSRRSAARSLTQLAAARSQSDEYAAPSGDYLHL